MGADAPRYTRGPLHRGGHPQQEEQTGDLEEARRSRGTRRSSRMNAPVSKTTEKSAITTTLGIIVMTTIALVCSWVCLRLYVCVTVNNAIIKLIHHGRYEMIHTELDGAAETQ